MALKKAVRALMSSAENFPLSRSSLLSLLVVYVFVVVLHYAQLPVWFFVFCFGVFIWRYNILRGQWHSPNKIKKILLMLVGSAGMLLEYSQWFSIEPMVSLLLLAITLKLLEFCHRL